MNFSLILLLFGIFLLFSGFVIAHDESIYFVDNDQEGQACQIENSTVVGKCSLITNCRTENTNFTICPNELRHLAQLVCCPEVKIKTTSRLTTTRISQQKCDEYNNNPKNFKPHVTFAFGDVFYENVEYIVGGVNANPAEYPHMAAIGWLQADETSKFNCGGSLISENYVVTAAHCSSDSENKAPDIVRISEHNLKKTMRWNYQQFDIIEIILHPNYKFSSVYDDIGLIKLNGSVIFSYTARPACLWQTYSFTQSNAVATGWGSAGYMEDFVEILQKVTLNIISNELCQSFVNPQRKFLDGLRSTQMCAGKLSGGKDTCQGDSGGPLQFKAISRTEGMHYLIGITSFGTFCGAPNSPGVYTRVSSYLDWIENIVWPQNKLN